MTRTDIDSVAMRVVEAHRGLGWQAIAIAIMYDRREVVPSFAAMEWAPGGKWGDAAKGDARTWRGYELHAQLVQDKVTQPRGCTIPTNQAYTLNDEFNKATLENPDATEEAVIEGIAKRHGMSAPAVYEQVVTVEDWTMC